MVRKQEKQPHKQARQNPPPKRPRCVPTKGTPPPSPIGTWSQQLALRPRHTLCILQVQVKVWVGRGMCLLHGRGN